jgi:Fe2+ transport system protein FeoA
VSSLAIPLSDLPVGAVARVVEARLDSGSCQMLQALGVTTECQLRLCQKGEPCIVQVRAARIGLSNIVARGIFVIPQAHDRA